MATGAERVIPEIKLIDDDGEPLETPWHLVSIAILLDCVTYYLQPRTDYFVGGNMFLYYSLTQARKRDLRGPDFFFVDHVDGTRPRRWWAVWEEDGRYPDVILELLSESTAKIDLTVKKDLYEQTFRTHEYFCCNPDTLQLKGWRLGKQGRYQAIHPDANGRLACEKLGLWIGMWTGSFLHAHGTFPRFYAAQGRLVPTHAEAEKQRADHFAAEVARLKSRSSSKRRTNGRGGKGGK
jgi:Uma2 family endonuclease